MQKIVPIEPKDVPVLLKLISKEFPYKSFDEEQFNERVLQPSVFVFKIVQGKELAGFIDLEFLSEGVGRITAMSVLEKFRGKNLGKKLAEFAINFFKKQACRKIVLLVRKENEAAKKIYALAGFQKTRTLEKKIDDAIVEEMELALEKGKAVK